MNRELIYVLVVILAAVLIGIAVYARYRHHVKAKALVCKRTDEQKLADINYALQPFGFAYDLKRDIFYSRRDAWQKQTGYGKLYDALAPTMSMIIDCLPIYFEHMGRKWMVELWKGQYGITTGAEVGVYVEQDGKTKNDPADVFYGAASAEEELGITMTLYKNGRKLFVREDRHWWLTGFRLGEFSNPNELAIRVCIQFQDLLMQQAFVGGCYDAGLTPQEVSVGHGCVMLDFGYRKRACRSFAERIIIACVQWNNRKNCRRYLRVTCDFERTIDRLDYLMMEFPRLFRAIVKWSRIGEKKPSKGKRRLPRKKSGRK